MPILIRASRSIEAGARVAGERPGFFPTKRAPFKSPVLESPRVRLVHTTTTHTQYFAPIAGPPCRDSRTRRSSSGFHSREEKKKKAWHQSQRSDAHADVLFVDSGARLWTTLSPSRTRMRETRHPEVGQNSEAAIVRTWANSPPLAR